MAVHATKEFRDRVLAATFDRLEDGKTYTAEDLKVLRAEVEFEMTGGEEVIPDPTENVGPSVGDVITTFKEIMALPQGTLLVTPQGESIRIGKLNYTEPALLAQKSWGRYDTKPLEELDPDGQFADHMLPRIVWLP